MYLIHSKSTKPEPLLIRNIAVLSPVLRRRDAVVERHGVGQWFHQYVAVVDGKVAYIGSDEAQAQAILPTTFDVYEGRGKLLMPAFANAHTHLAMVLMRNTADDLVLHDWLNQNIFPREDKLTPQAVYTGSFAGICESIQGGTVALADMYPFYDACIQAANDLGVRLNVCLIPEESDLSKADVLRVQGVDSAEKGAIQTFDPAWLRPSIILHAVYTTSDERIQTLVKTAQKYRLPIHVHVSETQKEVADCLAACGLTPPQKLAKMGVFDGQTIAAHCVHLTPEDRQILARKQVFCVHNPTSNLKLGSGMADIVQMLADDVRLCLGTDGAASNNRLDMYSEMRLAANLAKGLHGSAAIISAETVFKMATIWGYQALGFSGGVLEVGQPFDAQILDHHNLGILPEADLCATVVYSAGREDVESVCCGGRFLMKDRRLTQVNLEALRLGLSEAAKALELDV